MKKKDIKFRAQNRRIVLTIDNFSGHNITYQPTNIHVVFFAPNLTSFVQPLDAGVIRCFKAHYRRSFCLRAIELDEVGERDIYKMDLLKAMKMARQAWDHVQSETIKNCWDHTKIQRYNNNLYKYEITHIKYLLAHLPRHPHPQIHQAPSRKHQWRWCLAYPVAKLGKS